MWDVTGGDPHRLDIARDPNWTITDPDDPFTNWYQWETFQGAVNRGILTDSEHLKGKPADFYKDGWIWTQHAFLMGTPHRVKIGAYDPVKGSFRISSPGGANYGNSPNRPARLRAPVHYYIEDVRGVLDTADEYFYDRTGPNPGRLFLRPEDGVDPNHEAYEVVTTKSPVEIRDKSYITISGLRFSFNDNYDGKYGWPLYIGAAPMVRVIGTCSNITVKNCKFYNVMNAVVAFPRPTNRGGPAGLWSKNIGPFHNDVMNDITITDNDVRNSDQLGTIWVVGSSGEEPFGRLGHVEVLRNRVVHCGYRPGSSPTSSIPAISVVLAQTAEIAGNIVDTSWGNGIFTLGGKGSGSTNDAPLSRILIHHNLAENTMLGCNDYGGLEMFQGGPAYFYDNVSRNCVGTRTFTGSELGYSLYLDGGFKIYCFNNIIEGKIKPSESAYYNNCGYFMVFGFLDQLFNNTIYHFKNGLNGSSGNRSCVLGNVVADCSRGFIVQNRPGDVSMEFGGDTGEMGRIGIATMAYGDNVFYGKPSGGRGGEGAFGVIGGTRGPGRPTENIQGSTLQELRAGLEKMQCRVSQIGWQADKMPLVDPAGGDYRPTPDSAALNRGVKFFVPWGLYGEVGEWNFTKSEHTPQVVLGENFYMQPELVSRDMYYYVPRNDLTVSQCTPDDYVSGPLEDWIPGALRFDGKRTAVLTNAEMTKDVDYRGRRGDEHRSRAPKRKTLDMGTNNFLIEAYFRTDAGQHGRHHRLQGRRGRATRWASTGRAGRCCVCCRAARSPAPWPPRRPSTTASGTT